MTFDSDGRYYCRVDYSTDTLPLMPALRVYVYRMVICLLLPVCNGGQRIFCIFCSFSIRASNFYFYVLSYF